MDLSPPRRNYAADVYKIKSPQSAHSTAKGEWGNEGKGISMGSTGEPKSGTTWMQTIITKIALQLCGSPSNSWCKMGGLKIIPNKAGPSYEWEMLYADSEELYLHFAVEGRKHTIPGFGVGHGCNELGRHHRDSFEKFYPCKDTTGRISRDQLLRCLPDTSERCAREMPSRDPSVERMSVVFRDPRNVVISERRYKKKILHMEDLPNLDDYIHQRFENIVSWQHQRWVWHTTFYQNVSHVMIYEEVKAHQSSLVDLAAFLGLDCSPEEALVIWQMHHEYKPNSSTHRTFNSYGLPLETIGWMNSTMMALLPEDLVPRWGLRPPPA